MKSIFKTFYIINFSNQPKRLRLKTLTLRKSSCVQRRSDDVKFQQRRFHNNLWRSIFKWQIYGSDHLPRTYFCDEILRRHPAEWADADYRKSFFL